MKLLIFLHHTMLFEGANSQVMARDYHNKDRKYEFIELDIDLFRYSKEVKDIDMHWHVF